MPDEREEEAHGAEKEVGDRDPGLLDEGEGFPNKGDGGTSDSDDQANRS
jgi:hypothetical protein